MLRWRAWWIAACAWAAESLPLVLCANVCLLPYLEVLGWLWAAFGPSVGRLWWEVCLWPGYCVARICGGQCTEPVQQIRAVVTLTGTARGPHKGSEGSTTLGLESGHSLLNAQAIIQCQ